jgi:hypothetical protein
MQKKHLIAFTLVTIFMLLGFNIINSNRHEQSRAVQVESETPVGMEVNTVVESENTSSSSSSADSAAQPLGEQPKAILDKATTQVEQAQQVEQQRLETMDNAQ